MSASPIPDPADREDAPEGAGEDAPAPVLAAVREKHPSSGRSRTIPATRKLSPAEVRTRWKEDNEYEPRGPRPVTRADCKGQDRPCPWVSCAAHLYLDVDENTGALKINFPDLEVWELPFSCSIDEAEASDDGMTLEEVAARTNLTRERVRQLEERVKREVRPIAEAIESGDPLPPRRRLRVIPGA